ncbi:MAG: aquaporin [Gammaproteobacteria bacterium]
MANGMGRSAIVAEFIGTFTLVFIGTAVAVLAGSGMLQPGMSLIAVPFAFGFTLLVLVYAIGPVSGCHVNPAVTLGMWLAKRVSTQNAACYIVAQVLAGIAASIVLLFILFGIGADLGAGVQAYSKSAFGVGANTIPSFFALGPSLLLEALLTALFIFVILCATAAKAHPQAAGLAIGGFLFVAHLLAVPLGGSSLNPARSIGPALVQGGEALSVLWVYIVAPVIGGLVGYGLYKMIHPASQ